MIRFTSPAAAAIDMLDEHGDRLLELVGKDRGVRGIIAPEEIPAALSALRAAITKDAPAHARPEDTDDAEEQIRRAQDVDLGRRAYPLIDMLERAAKKNKPVTWGV